ncbi:MAG: ABC transporter ATP-binding protein [Deltaproteobacteria bacterium]|nr:ABC transporter ATP-binding protein [Deltaproteobacteria bacterium]
METVVEARGLTKEFNGFRAVDNISFDILRGEIVGLLGPNGAGKTTTLHMLLGLTTPTAGDIRILGRNLEKDREEILSRVNFSSSYVSLPYSLTVWENLSVFAGLYGVKRPGEKLKGLIKTFEIEDIKDSATRKLSSGQITRVSLAKSLLNDPEVLFLDEPTSSLDPDMADRTRKLLKDIKEKKGLSILYTSHNMKEMEEMCDRIIFLDRGKILAEGRPSEVMREFKGASLEEVFLKIARKEKTCFDGADG